MTGKYDEEKFCNEHTYIYCHKLGQKRHTKCCALYCADKDQKFSQGWQDKCRNSCKQFQLWLPEELRAKVKVDKRKKRKKGEKVQTVVSTQNINVNLDDLVKEGKGRPPKKEMLNASRCAVKYMGETSCSDRKAAEYVAQYCRLTPETIMKNIGKVNC